MSLTDIIMGVKYPITAVVLEQFDNKLDIKIRPGRVMRKAIKAEDGIVHSSYFVFKDDKDKVKIPAPDTKLYSSLEKLKKIYYLKLDRTTYWPVTNTGHQLTVQIPHPMFETEEKDGETVYKLDANKKRIPVIETIYDLDESGKKKLDKEDKPIIIERKQAIEYEERPIFDSRVLLKNGAVTLPAMVANQNYEVGEWLALENIKTQKLYRLKNWWANNSTMMIMFLGCLFSFLIFYYGVQKFAEISASNNAILTQSTNSVVTAMQNLAGNGAAAKPPM